MRQGLEYIAQAHPAPSYEALRPAMAFREQVMAEQVGEVLDRNPGSRIALLAHNAHLARADDGIAGPKGAVGAGGDLVPSLGTALARRHPGDIFAVWMLQDQGRDGRPLPGTTGEIKSVRGSLNAALAEVGEVFALPVAQREHATRWLDDPVDVISLYGNRLQLRVREQVDVLFFVREVTPLDGCEVESRR